MTPSSSAGRKADVPRAVRRSGSAWHPARRLASRRVSHIAIRPDRETMGTVPLVYFLPGPGLRAIRWLRAAQGRIHKRSLRPRDATGRGGPGHVTSARTGAYFIAPADREQGAGSLWNRPIATRPHSYSKPYLPRRTSSGPAPDQRGPKAPRQGTGSSPRWSEPRSPLTTGAT
jgi:hypothetical protein